jgi:hypothetical protein
MDSHYIVIADHGHLKIFKEYSEPGQSTPGLDEVYVMDFPHGRLSYVDSDTDMAGRFQGSKQQGRGSGTPTSRTGMSIDERMPMEREADRRQTEDVAAAIEAFLSGQPTASWDFAAGPTGHNAILAHLSPQIRSRLRSSISKNLVNQPRAELLSHFRHAA